MLFVHLKRILKRGRLRLRGPYGAHDEFLMGAAAQNLRKLAKLVWKPPIRGYLCLHDAKNHIKPPKAAQNAATVVTKP